MTELEYGNSTLELIKDLLSRGINKFSVMLRHSARYYDHEHPEMEPFLVLTEEGKRYSLELGCALPEGLEINLFSSAFGRCIETAYMIDKGYVSKNGTTYHNRVEKLLSPSYVKKPFELAATLGKPHSDFIRTWFDGEIPLDIMESPKKAAGDILQGLVERLPGLSENSININVTHDWNLYLVKEQIMGLKHEEVGPVEYLEGLVVYESAGQVFIENHQKQAIPF
jgi:hypothetical protein